MSNRAQAPRFRVYAKKHFGDRSVFTWSREEWDAIVAEPQQAVLVDVTQTPLSGIAADACFIACEAERFSSSDGHIYIYRYDPADEPTPYNKDGYQVWRGESLWNHPKIEEMAAACLTTADANLHQYLEENVFIVKEEPSNDHWLSLSELPQSVRVIIRQE